MCKSTAINKLILISSFLLFLIVGLNVNAQGLIETYHHKITAEITPGLKMLKASDTITFPASAQKKISFTLHKNLTINTISAGDKVILLHAGTATDAYSEWGIELAHDDNQITIEYNGMIYDDPADGDSSGFISNEAAVLLGNSFWYPEILGSLKSFEITVSHPQNWVMATQGQILTQETFNNVKTTKHTEVTPQQDIYLIIGPFFEYSKELKTGKIIRVLLRKDEKDLAQNYLTLIPDYIEHYSQTIAIYPYSHFTVIENFWETGYGMPSFTLLGPSVLRLPFILTTSLPHEILHNWWGNSVYISSSGGNWSEGLTTYLADHWQQKMKNNDAEYRMNQLIGYADFVKSESDFPLSDFQTRNSEATQAIGYGKSSMFFHMLELKVGTTKFQSALQNFYLKNLFRFASYDDIRISFEETTGLDLLKFFQQWIERTGAPEIHLGSVTPFLWADSNWATSWELNQDPTNIYDLDIPVRWTLENGKILNQIINLKDAQQNYTLLTDSKPIKIEIDPDFDVFRKLFPEERPATFSSIFGSTKTSVFYNKQNEDLLKMTEKWRDLFGTNFTNTEVLDSFTLPSDGSIILLGNSNTMREFVRNQVTNSNLKINNKELSIDSSSYLYSDHSLALVFKAKSNPQQNILWIPSAMPPVDELASRMTHYSKYSLLAFKGKPNVLKKTLPSSNSPLKRRL